MIDADGDMHVPETAIRLCKEAKEDPHAPNWTRWIEQARATLAAERLPRPDTEAR